MKLIVTPEAAEDLREIEEYIGNDNPKAAIGFVNRLTERFQELTRFPGIGRKRDEMNAGYRSIAHGDYVIFYATVADTVEILRVIHAKRDLGKALSDDRQR